MLMKNKKILWKRKNGKIKTFWLKHGILAKSRHLTKITASVISVFPWFSTVPTQIAYAVVWFRLERRTAAKNCENTASAVCLLKANTAERRQMVNFTEKNNASLNQWQKRTVTASGLHL